MKFIVGCVSLVAVAALVVSTLEFRELKDIREQLSTVEARSGKWTELDAIKADIVSSKVDLAEIRAVKQDVSTLTENLKSMDQASKAVGAFQELNTGLGLSFMTVVAKERELEERVKKLEPGR